MSTNRDNQQFDSAVEKILQNTWEFYPNLASGLGLHEYDGRLPDISRPALARRQQDVEKDIQSLERIDAAALSRQNAFDRRQLAASLNKELFELTELKTHETNPMEMMWHIELSNYIKRDYAPLDQRVETLTKALQAVPAFLDSLQNGLSPRLSNVMLEASIEAYEGLVSFYDKDLPEAMKVLTDQGLKQTFETSRATASQAISAFAQHLKTLKDNAGDDFAMGEDGFRGLLRHGEMVDLPLERLLEVGTEDLARNLARLRHVAAQIDSARSPSQVMAEIAKDHPTAESLLPDTSDMLEDIRQFLIDHDIVSVPSEVRCQTTETPTFMRWAFAAMDMPGPFETQAAEAYYYVTPVEDHWTEQQKEEWLRRFNYASLQNTSIHEAYPGHYVHHLHAKSAPSKISLAFGAYSFWEGWGHYTEEMMIEEGYGKGDPRFVLGQLGDALLRDCRYLCTIRMHTQGMTVEEAARFFMENAYLEELPASKEAMRGTFDPMYLNYTLGKLMILKLREDYRHEQGAAFSLKKFHDTFLSFGAPPIPLVREMMLREPGEGAL